MSIFGRRNKILKIKPFDHTTSSDPEIAALVVAFVDAGAEKGRLGQAIPRDLPHGETLLRKDPAWNRRTLSVLLEVAAHWRDEFERLRDETAQNSPERSSLFREPEFGKIGSRQYLATNLAEQLCRRKLDLDEDKLIFLIRTATKAGHPGFGLISVAAAIRQAKHVLNRDALSEQVQSALLDLRADLDRFYDNDAAGQQTDIDRMLASDERNDQASSSPIPPSDIPAAVVGGHPSILVQLKHALGLRSTAPADVPTEILEPDAFRLRADSPLTEQHHLITELLTPCVPQSYRDAPRIKGQTADRILRMTSEQRGQLLLAACERR